MAERVTTQILTYTFRCTAPEALFTEKWADIPSDIQQGVIAQNGLPCDGGGVPYMWCYKCQWGKILIDAVED